MGTTLGQSITVGGSTFWVAYQVDLGQVLLGTILLAILAVQITRWIGDLIYR